jgi:hypothetical protein
MSRFYANAILLVKRITNTHIHYQTLFLNWVQENCIIYVSLFSSFVLRTVIFLIPRSLRYVTTVHRLIP